MSDRDRILKKLRAHTPPPQELPSLAQPWITYADRSRQFAEALQSVGGRCLFVPSREAIPALLAEHPAWSSARKVISLVPDVLPGNIDVATITDPHQLEDVDFAIARGQFGVAENGAIWLEHVSSTPRALYFIVQHLVLVLPAAELVDNMHQAYERLQFAGPSYGVFISGPSKTADIEQSLVIGAHGPRSLTVFCTP